MTETQNIEYKESWRDEYLKWICGFANAQGGRIYIGVRDDGTVCGAPDARRLMEDIPNKIRDTMGIIADVNLLEADGKPYIEVVVQPSSYPVSYHGEYHYRSGSTKQQLRGAALTEFLVRKTGYRWDAVPMDGVSVRELDEESFEIFRREAMRTGRMTRQDVECDNEELLDKLGLLSEGKLKRAAVLLFYRRPQRFFTGSYVKIGRFGVGSDLQYQDAVEGSLMLMADRVIDLIYLKYLKAAISYEKETRVETYPFAREAVREAVYNALIHSRWEDGIPIQIRIEDDQMIISNSCAFPSDWTAETLMQTHRSRPYNPDLANTFYRAGYVEAWGRGIQKICEECRLYGEELPEYSVRGDEISVRFHAIQSAQTGSALAPKDQNGANNGANSGANMEDALIQGILALIEKNPGISQSAIAEKLQIPRRTLQRKMDALKAAGQITHVGSKFGGAWQIIGEKKS